MRRRIGRLLGRDASARGGRAGGAFGYIHIGKTGGTSVGRANEALRARGLPHLEMLGHSTTLAKVAGAKPSLRVSFTLRDPLERIVSAFNSRMRQSRPTYTAPWKTEEAIAYLWFPTVADFFRALVTADERLKSAGLFAMQHLGHVRRGYAFHFGSTDEIDRHADRIYHIGDLSEGTSGLRGYFAPLDLPDGLVGSVAGHHHSGGASTRDSLSDLDPGLLAEVRAYFADEYEIYDHLRAARADRMAA